MSGARPLVGRRIVVTRAEEQADPLAEQLEALGAEVVVCPLIAIAPPLDIVPLRDALARLAEYDWLLLTSANAVHAVFERVAAGALPARLAVGAVGPATARALAAYGVETRFVPSAYTAEAMVAEFGDAAGRRVLLPASELARETLAAGLRARGALVDVVTAYRNVPGPGAPRLAALLHQEPIDAITFTSPSTVHSLLAALAERGGTDAGALLGGVALVSIGPTTAAALDEAGLPTIAAREHTAEGIVEVLVECFADTNDTRP